jgi:hypothetical protein
MLSLDGMPKQKRSMLQSAQWFAQTEAKTDHRGALLHTEDVVVRLERTRISKTTMACLLKSVNTLANACMKAATPPRPHPPELTPIPARARTCTRTRTRTYMALSLPLDALPVRRSKRLPNIDLPLDLNAASTLRPDQEINITKPSSMTQLTNQTTKLQNYKTTKLQNYKTTKLPTNQQVDNWAPGQLDKHQPTILPTDQPTISQQAKQANLHVTCRISCGLN